MTPTDQNWIKAFRDRYARFVLCHKPDCEDAHCGAISLEGFISSLLHNQKKDFRKIVSDITSELLEINESNGAAKVSFVCLERRILATLLHTPSAKEEEKEYKGVPARKCKGCGKEANADWKNDPLISEHSDYCSKCKVRNI